MHSKLCNAKYAGIQDHLGHRCNSLKVYVRITIKRYDDFITIKIHENSITRIHRFLEMIHLHH